jgi:hypothetical protein
MKVDQLVLQSIAVSTGLSMKYLSVEKDLVRDLRLSQMDLDLLLYDLESVFEVRLPKHFPLNTPSHIIRYIEQECFSQLEPPPLPF